MPRTHDQQPTKMYIVQYPRTDTIGATDTASTAGARRGRTSWVLLHTCGQQQLAAISSVRRPQLGAASSVSPDTCTDFKRGFIGSPALTQRARNLVAEDMVTQVYPLPQSWRIRLLIQSSSGS
jgi:hypothetical protein